MALVRFGRGMIPSMFRDVFGEDFFAPFFEGEGRWYPEVDMYEDREGVTLEAEVPGVRKEDLKVEYQNGMLTVSGERKEERKKEGERGFISRERRYGTFSRSFRISEDLFDVQRIKATYDNGLLKVQIPRKKVPETKAVEINVE